MTSKKKKPVRKPSKRPVPEPRKTVAMTDRAALTPEAPSAAAPEASPEPLSSGPPAAMTQSDGKSVVALAASLKGEGGFYFAPSRTGGLPAGGKIESISLGDEVEGNFVLKLAGGDPSATTHGVTEGFSIRVPDSLNAKPANEASACACWPGPPPLPRPAWRSLIQPTRLVIAAGDGSRSGRAGRSWSSTGECRKYKEAMETSSASCRPVWLPRGAYPLVMRNHLLSLRTGPRFGWRRARGVDLIRSLLVSSVVAAISPTTGWGASVLDPPPALGHTFDLKEFGAVCDGVHDDTKAIQAWLDKLAANVRLSASPELLVQRALEGAVRKRVGHRGQRPVQHRVQICRRRRRRRSADYQRHWPWGVQGRLISPVFGS